MELLTWGQLTESAKEKALESFKRYYYDSGLNVERKNAILNCLEDSESKLWRNIQNETGFIMDSSCLVLNDDNSAYKIVKILDIDYDFFSDDEYRVLEELRDTFYNLIMIDDETVSSETDFKNVILEHLEFVKYENLSGKKLEIAIQSDELFSSSEKMFNLIKNSIEKINKIIQNLLQDAEKELNDDFFVNHIIEHEFEFTKTGELVN